MNDLIAAWTRAGKAFAEYYEKQANPLRTTEAPAKLSEDTPKATRTRKPKEPEAAAPAAPTPPAAAPAPAPAAQPEMTDKESYDELCRLAISFIAADKPGTEERRGSAMKHVGDTYKVAALSAVPHGPQRLQLIGWFKDQLIAGAQKAPTPAPAGFGV
ncbi:MAG: hypothetical protein V4510_12660 [bacterium]